MIRDKYLKSFIFICYFSSADAAIKQQLQRYMYIPGNNTMTDQQEIVSFIKRFSFGTLVTCTKDGHPTATHLPFLIDVTGDCLELISHFAKANPQWKEIDSNENILAIFREPHAYISPTNYEKELVVPTWNYIAVHLYGKGLVITEPQQVSDILDRTVTTYEPAYKATHDALPEDFKTRMQNGVVAFKIRVTEIQGKKKLSQNKTKTEQEKIIQTLSQSKETTEQQIAEYMQKML